MRFGNVCRVCLREYDELTPLQAKLPDENKTFVESLNFVVNIDMKLEDGLPDKICKNCEIVLDLADAFKQRCLESEAILSQQCAALGKQKGAVESRPIFESNCQENSEVRSEDTSSLPALMPCISSQDTLVEAIGNAENIYDIAEYEIKMEIVDESIISEQAHLDAAQECEAALSKSQEQCSEENYTEKTISRSEQPCIKKPDLGDIQQTTAVVTSATEEQEAAVSPANTIIETEDENDENTNKIGLIQKKHKNKLKLNQNKETKSYKAETNIESAHKTAGKLKLSHTNTDNKITRVTEINSQCIISGDVLTCDICEFTTAKITDLNAHICAHAATKRYSCDLCPYLTIYSRNYEAHVRIHTGGKPYSCNICEKKFIFKSHLNRHVIIHTDEKPFSCYICQKKYSQKGTLNAHMRVHTGDKPYSCNICPKKFRRKTDLDVHVRIHTGDKPYTCNICEKKFRHKCSLDIHVRTHTGDKPYTCNICEKKFRQKYSLDVHVRTHTGDKPYTCNICEKKFRQKCSLDVHVRTHTGDKNVN